MPPAEGTVATDHGRGQELAAGDDVTADEPRRSVWSRLRGASPRTLAWMVTVPVLAGVGAVLAGSVAQDGDLDVPSAPATAPTESPTQPVVSESPAAPYVVVAITDGDTVDLLGPDGAITVRLAQVDAPEVGECWANESTAGLHELAPPGTAVTVRRPGPPFTDTYGRTLGELLRDDGTSISVELVGGGDAGFDARFADEDADLAARLRFAEEQARASRVGLWGACGGPHEPVAASPPGGRAAPRQHL
ncbi:MAG: thermonuclease family protein [Actinobacteria bacterium]|nr:thermonuclease family protein [Actinomycetota bacterium]